MREFGGAALAGAEGGVITRAVKGQATARVSATLDAAALRKRPWRCCLHTAKRAHCSRQRAFSLESRYTAGMSVQWFPGHMTKALRELSALIPSQDVIIEVVDARLPASSSNPVLSELRGLKPCIKVLSKSDLADPALTSAWLSYFRSQPNVSALVSSAGEHHVTRQRISELSRDAALTRGPNKEVRALIAGVPNVGKSTLINILMQRSVAAVSDKPAVTKEQQTVVLKDGTWLTDSPGVTWPKMEDELGALRLAFAGSIPDTAIDYLTVALSGAELLLERYAALLVTRYKLKQTPESPTALLTEIGRRRGGLRPGGVVDLHKAAEILVHEFRAGTLGRITLEAPPG